MATYTDNYNLKKPDGTDYVDIQDINNNMDAIDTALKENTLIKTDPIEISGTQITSPTSTADAGLTIKGKKKSGSRYAAVRIVSESTDNRLYSNEIRMDGFRGPAQYMEINYLQGNTDGISGTDYVGIRQYIPSSLTGGYFGPLKTDTYSLGNTSSKWSAVYATNGTIQTSDIRAKNDVKIIPQGDADGGVVMCALDGNGSSVQDVTRDDLIKFFKNIDIYTYVSDPTHTLTVQEAIDENEFEKIHVGVIANDITDSKLFPYIGYKDMGDDNAPLGIKYESLGVLALYAVRDLYSKIEALENEVAVLKKKIET